MAVTYGIASAPYLAIRCLKQLAYENNAKYSDASSIIINYFYVNDLMTSFENESAATHICHEISGI